MYGTDHGRQERIVVFGADGAVGAELVASLRLRGVETCAFSARDPDWRQHYRVLEAIRERDAASVLYVFEPSLDPSPETPGENDAFYTLVSAVGNVAHAASTVGSVFVLASVPGDSSAFETAVCDAAERLVRKLHTTAVCFRAVDGSESDKPDAMTSAAAEDSLSSARFDSRIGRARISEAAERGRDKARKRWWEGDGRRLSNEGLIRWLILSASIGRAGR